MKIIITGASGFIARNLVKQLLKESGTIVYSVSRSPIENGSTWIESDLAHPGWTEKLPQSADVVVHLAQSKRYREFPDGAPDMIRININATAELLEWARTHGVQQFIFASTGNVYERSEPRLLKETDACMPDSMYAATKLSAEYIVQQYSTFFKTICLRIFGVYGPGQKDMLMPRLAANIRAGNTVTLDGGQGLSLSPLYIDECVEFISRLLKTSGERHSVYNLAGNEVLTLRQIAEEISRAAGVPLKTERKDSVPQFFAAANTKICNETDYIPKTDFKKGISLTILE